MPDQHEPVVIPDGATPAEAQMIASFAVVRVQLGQALGVSGDHEQRIRALEARKFISPTIFWVGLTGAFGIAAAIATIVLAAKGVFG